MTISAGYMNYLDSYSDSSFLHELFASLHDYLEFLPHYLSPLPQLVDFLHEPQLST